MESFIKFHWLVEGRVIMLVLQGEITAAQLNQYDQDILATFESVEQPIYIIADLRRLTRFPSIGDCLRLKSLRHRNLGTTVMMGAIQNRLLKFFMSAITTILPVSYKDAETFEQAQRYIMSIDPQLPASEEWQVPLTQKGWQCALLDEQDKW